MGDRLDLNWDNYHVFQILSNSPIQSYQEGICRKLQLFSFPFNISLCQAVTLFLYFSPSHTFQSFVRIKISINTFKIHIVIHSQSVLLLMYQVLGGFIPLLEGDKKKSLCCGASADTYVCAQTTPTQILHIHSYNQRDRILIQI